MNPSNTTPPERSRRLWDISPALNAGTPPFSGDTAYSQEWTARLGPGCPVNISAIRLSPHVGAHADAPLHYADGRPAIGEVDLAPYLGPCRVIHAIGCGALIQPGHLAHAAGALPARVLVRTCERAPTQWSADFTAFAPETIDWLAARGVTKNVAFTVPTTNLVAGSAGANMALVTNDAIYILASYETQTAPTVPPVHFNFVIKCDLNGVKLLQTALTSYSLADYQVQTLHSIAPNGDYIFTIYSQNLYRLMKVTTAGAMLFSVNILSDLPSSTLGRIEQNADGSAIFETWYSNSQSGVTKFNATTGAIEWNMNLGTAFASQSSDGFFEQVFVRNGSVTADGGIVVAFDFWDYNQNPPAGYNSNGFVYGKLSPSGQLVWVKKDVTIGLLRPAIGTADGGVIFEGVKTTGANYEFMKLNSLGELTPNCGGTTPMPDLTLANFTTTQTTVAVGSVFNFKFDLKNIGNAAATGNFNIKSYLSTDNVLSTNDIQDGVIPTGNLAAGQTIAQVTGALTVPVGTAAGNYFIILKVDADGQVTESNENNNILVSASTVVVSSGGSVGADLKITISADKTIVPQWGSVNYTITAKNEGTAQISIAVVKIGGCAMGVLSNFDQAFKLVYAGTPAAPTAGTYNFVTQEWTLNNLAAGAQGVLTFTLFTTGTAEKKVVAFAKSQSPTDPDSQPSTTVFSNCIPAQDDEAVFTINMGQAFLIGGTRQPEQSMNVAEMADFQLFPNPAGEYVYISLGKWQNKSVTVSMFNQLGIKVLEKNFEKISPLPEIIDLSEISNGQYFLKFEMTGERPFFGKLVVARNY